MNLEEIGFVLSITPYREHDGLVHFLGESIGLVRLILPGYYKSNSKQGNLGLEFTKVRYRVKEYKPNRLNRIINGEMIDAYRSKRNDFDWLLMMSLMSEVTIKTFDQRYEDVFYRGMQAMFESINLKNDAIDFMREIIEIHGFKPFVDGCVVCAKAQINDFSIEKGGFVCPDHAHFRAEKEVLVSLYRAFKSETPYECENTEIQDEVFRKCVNYVAYHSDIVLQSWKLWDEI